MRRDAALLRGAAPSADEKDRRAPYGRAAGLFALVFHARPTVRERVATFFAYVVFAPVAALATRLRREGGFVSEEEGDVDASRAEDDDSDVLALPEPLASQLRFPSRVRTAPFPARAKIGERVDVPKVRVMLAQRLEVKRMGGAAGVLATLERLMLEDAAGGDPGVGAASSLPGVARVADATAGGPPRVLGDGVVGAAGKRGEPRGGVRRGASVARRPRLRPARRQRARDGVLAERRGANLAGQAEHPRGRAVVGDARGRRRGGDGTLDRRGERRDDAAGGGRREGGRGGAGEERLRGWVFRSGAFFRNARSRVEHSESVGGVPVPPGRRGRRARARRRRGRRRGVRRRARGGAAGVRGSGRGDGGGGVAAADGGDPRRPGVQGLALAAELLCDVDLVGVVLRGLAADESAPYGARVAGVACLRAAAEACGAASAGRAGGDPDAAAADLADAAIDPLIAKVCAVKLGEDDSTGGFDERSSEEDPGTRGSALVDAGLEALAKTCEAAPAAVWSDAWARNGATFWLARLARDPNPARRASAWRLLAVAASPARARRRVCWLGRGRRRRARRRARRWISTRPAARSGGGSSRRVSPRWPPRTRHGREMETRPWTSSRS